VSKTLQINIHTHEHAPIIMLKGMWTKKNVMVSTIGPFGERIGLDVDRMKINNQKYPDRWKVKF